jgi:hypothetical protein
MRPAIFLLALGYSGAAWAVGAAQLTFADGLEIEADLLETRGTGFQVRTVQGEWFVPFDDLLNFVELPEGHRSTPVTWTIVLDAAPEALPAATLALTALQGLDVVSGERAGAEAFAAVERCSPDVDCMAASHQPASWTWFLRADLDADGLLRLRARHTLLGSTSVEQAGSASAGPLAVVGAVARSLGLVAPTAIDASAAAALQAELDRLDRARPVSMSPARVAALSFVPVPGLPSLLKRDHAAFGAAFATTVGVSAALVASTGAASTRRGEQIGLSVLGTYVASVASSQLFGHFGVRRAPAVALAPVVGPGGVDGAALQISMTLGAR